ncbi:MAG: S8 family serine peptidase [Fibrobacter sp.]|nr:S8 family serine peptidase [Fibrobacter sp.]
MYDSDKNILWGSDPLTGKNNSDVELWNDRNGNSIVPKYNGNTSEVQKAGRFWMLKEASMNKKETELLKQAGVTRLTASSWGDKSIILLKSNVDVKKKMLDSLVYGFYNSISVDDTTKLTTKFGSNDWIDEIQVCAPFGSCHTEVIQLTEVQMATRCWDDVSMDACKAIVESCGGSDAVIDRFVVISKNSRSTIGCLETKHDVQNLSVNREEKPTMALGRKAINIENLQLNRWNINFTGFNDDVTDSWLKGKAYTGEGIIVGIYDSGVYFDHDGLNEWVNGIKTPRRAYENPNKKENTDSPSNDHGTHVAGIVGGNGNGSLNHMYRGVAPKVKFYSADMSVNGQKGHVVNHSHTRESGVKYNYDNDLEKNIFYNWQTDSDIGDKLPKTFVTGSGNFANGKYLENVAEVNPCMYGMGFHSLSFDTKNGIVVGNYASKTKIPNTSSSYGPTWDGRIKPDLMAPGSGLQGSFDANNEFTVYLDEITFERTGVTYKFGNNSHVLGGEISNCTIPASVLASDKFNDQVLPSLCNYVREAAYTGIAVVSDDKSSINNVLQITNHDPLSGETYINWDYRAFQNTLLDVKKGDRIKIRMRLPANIRSFFQVLNGNIYLGNGDDFYLPNASYKRIDFDWNLGNNDEDYFETSILWTENDILAKYLRIGFSYDYNVFSSVPCEDFNGTACYVDLGGASMATPHVSGVVALMNQAYMKMTRSTTSLRNSTSKAILIHTADDMIDNVGFARTEQNDVKATTGNSVRVTYGKGPDFVTGWGGINAEKALKMIGPYRRFREFEIEEGMDKKWIVDVKNSMERLRLTLTWDDAPLSEQQMRSLVKNAKRLVNDLDMYLISPTGKFYYPWKLEPLSIEDVNENGYNKYGCSGTEKITEAEARRLAVRECDDGTEFNANCFDTINNVEVVDVDFPEKGKWVVVVHATKVRDGNSENGHAQIASIASDLALDDNAENVGCEISHPYRAQSSLTCTYDFGISLTNFVTFSNRTFVASGDYIQLLDDKDNVIGTYTGSQLAGVRLQIDSNMLKVRLESDNDSNVGYGFSIDKIERIPYSMLFGISH